ncbi:hypothetical protein SDC9_193493 [bioreactor metagenome]|uniref:Uncharacterized protein n=1 Tax=bioreactor metagenome TaxID=1076179 RepID=A0A645IC94_9ZZZZ
MVAGEPGLFEAVELARGEEPERCAQTDRTLPADLAKNVAEALHLFLGQPAAGSHH